MPPPCTRPGERVASRSQRGWWRPCFSPRRSWRGKALIPQAEPHAVSIPLAFAAGAVIASLADTLMPEAFEGGGPSVAFATVAGFLVWFVLATV